MSEFQANLKSEFEDKEYRDSYAEDYLNTYIAVQIKVLREQRQMTQADLAKRIGTKQAGVSRLENVNYTNWKTQTLKKIAKALDVRLQISFETFGTLLREAENFSTESLKRPNFADDPAFLSIEGRVPTLPESIVTFGSNVFIGNRPVVQAVPRVSRWHEGGQLGAIMGFPDGPVPMLALGSPTYSSHAEGSAASPSSQQQSLPGEASHLGSIVTASAGNFSD